ncbi:MAG: AbrB/MazE/SpoVT family DNA-binding domain-containing protein [Clostridiaceae bacterium]|nr:AbrB/MazE/SpoVT family DNA-binding domain-containing protein [Clostridiaceae bacterium]
MDVLNVSSKGQIVLPIEFRKNLNIKSGDKLAAFVSGDIIMLKRIDLPTEEDFILSLDEAADWAASVGYVEKDVNDIIQSVRKKKRK